MSAQIFQDLKTLVEVESPTDDLAACIKVVNTANEITQRLIGSPAEILDEKARPVYWLGSKTPQVVLVDIINFLEARLRDFLAFHALNNLSFCLFKYNR